MKELVKTNEKGETIIDEKEVDKHILTKDEIEKYQEKFIGLKEKQKTIDQLAKEALEEKETFEKEIKHLEEQLKDKNLSPEKIKELKGELKASKEKLAGHNTLVDEALAIQKDIKVELDERELTLKNNKEKINKLGNAIEKSKTTLEPNKHEELKQKHSLLANQNEAIINKDIPIIEADKRTKISKDVNIKEQATKLRNTMGKNGTSHVQNYMNNKKKNQERGR